MGASAGDTRETASCFVCAALLEERANLHVYDPKVEREQMFIEFKVRQTTPPHHTQKAREAAASETADGRRADVFRWCVCCGGWVAVHEPGDGGDRARTQGEQQATPSLPPSSLNPACMLTSIP